MDNQLVGYVLGAVCGGLVLLAMLAGGGYLIYSSISNKKKAAASQSWPSAPGIITNLDVRRSTSTDSDGDTTITYTPVIEYDYDVIGQTYHGSRVAFGAVTGYSSQGKAQEALIPYAIGGTVTVYYNPDNPSEAVLEQKAKSTTLTLVIGIVLILLALCAGCVAFAVAAINLLPQ